MLMISNGYLINGMRWCDLIEIFQRSGYHDLLRFLRTDGFGDLRVNGSALPADAGLVKCE